MNYKLVLACVVTLFVLVAFNFTESSGNPTAMLTLNSLNIEDVESTAAPIQDYWSTHKSNMSSLFESLLEKCELKDSDGPNREEVVTGFQVLELTQDVSGNGHNELERTYLIYDYVANNISYKVYKSWRNTSEVIETKEGDCTDKAILLVSMLRESGIDSYILFSSSKINDITHAWAVARVDNEWIELDPTTDSFFYVYNCRQKGCMHSAYYESLGGMFNSDVNLKCSNSG